MLLSIDSATAVAAPIGSVLAGRSIRGATFDHTGRLLVLDEANDELVEVDPTTGLVNGPAAELTVVGAPYNLGTGCDLTQQADGTFVLSDMNRIYSLDVSTGVMVLLHTDEVLDEGGVVFLVGLAVSPFADPASTLFAFDVHFADDVFTYDPAAGFTRTALYSNILSGYNAGRGDLAAAPIPPPSGAGEPTPIAPGTGSSLLLPNVPNPFHTSTTIAYRVDADSDVQLEVFTVSGRRVQTLASGEHAAGYYHVEWNGKDDAGRSMPAGAYICEVRAGSERQSRKVLLLN